MKITKEQKRRAAAVLAYSKMHLAGATMEAQIPGTDMSNKMCIFDENGCIVAITDTPAGWHDTEPSTSIGVKRPDKFARIFSVLLQFCMLLAMMAGTVRLVMWLFQ